MVRDVSSAIFTRVHPFLAARYSRVFQAAVSLRDVARVSKLTAYYRKKFLAFEELNPEHRHPAQTLLLKSFYVAQFQQFTKGSPKLFISFQLGFVNVTLGTVLVFILGPRISDMFNHVHKMCCFCWVVPLLFGPR